jgi:hypothetical protein
MLGNYRVAAQVVASRVVLTSTELVSYFAYCSVGVGVNRIMEITRNSGMIYVPVGYNAKTSVGNTEFSPFSLHHLLLVSEH